MLNKVIWILFNFQKGWVPENWYIEAGFGIENTLQLVRVDFYWRVTQRDVQDVQRFGIKIAVSPKL